MDNYEKFKSLLEYFVSHLAWKETGNLSHVGYNTYIKPLKDTNNFVEQGQGYNNGAIQNQICQWDEINNHKVFINIQPNFGSWRSRKCYLNWCDTGINIFCDWTNDSPVGLIIGYAYWWENPTKYDNLSQKTIKQLGLFQNGITQELISFLDDFTKEIDDYDQHRGNYFDKELEWKSMKNIENYLNILRSNKNLILTGAPGTGKTYLAKQIAEEIVSQKIKETPKNILLSAIDNYIIDDKLEKIYIKLLTDFKKQFPIENLQSLTLEDYCIGNSDENKDNFCYWMERKLKPLGYYFPGSSRSYLLYWSKSDGEYKIHGYLKQEKGKSTEELMSILASDIFQMVKDNNPLSMAKKYGESFILKILSTYYPDQYAPINSKNHIDNIISLFDIKCESKNVFERNKAIFGFYQELTKDKIISPWSFMHILYDNFNIKEGEVIQEGIINNNGDYYLVQFHPSYDYTDFVEGLRPINKEETKDISFVLQDGVFKRLCVTALQNPNKKYVMIIDEINRGEISKIFGELFFSIDPGYRGKKGKVLTQYANMQNNPNEFDLSLNIDESEDYGHFFVPKNVYIIGTMNDIDRSVESMDFAFRRRFAFKEIKANDTQTMLDDEKAWGKDSTSNTLKPDPTIIGEIKKRMNSLNDTIWDDETKSGIEGLSSAYHIGASYFLKLANYRNNCTYDDNSFKYLWDYHLEGLLREYLRGMQDIEINIDKLKKAYGYPSNSNNE